MLRVLTLDWIYGYHNRSFQSTVIIFEIWLSHLLNTIHIYKQWWYLSSISIYICVCDLHLIVSHYHLSSSSFCFIVFNQNIYRLIQSCSLKSEMNDEFDMNQIHCIDTCRVMYVNKKFNHLLRCLFWELYLHKIQLLLLLRAASGKRRDETNIFRQIVDNLDVSYSLNTSKKISIS